MKIEDKRKIKVTNRRYRPDYHVTAEYGWINDPNGFVYYKGYYHIFYQYYPYDSQWGPMHWGHKRSKDLVHWEQLPIALVPGDSEDKDGCFSGSAIVKGNRLYLIYTGHNLYDESDPDRFWQNQNVAYSDDGIHFKKYKDNPVIAHPPVNTTQHFRDPKVWERDGKYYLIVGGQNTDHKGHVLLYNSDDLLHWKFIDQLAESVGNEGNVWECPDMFRINGKDILLLSPQGIKSEERKYLNLYQTGYFVGQMNYINNKYTYNSGNFTELDKGHDFYATQTTLSPDGRRILLGWMDMWESKMPEQKDGWAGCLIFPRELTVKENRLLMKPVSELALLREKNIFDKKLALEDEQLELPDSQHCELDFDYDLANWHGNKFTIEFNDNDENKLSLSYDKDTSEFILYRSGEDAYRYGKVEKSKHVKVQILVDTSSVEIFINDGELVFTERYYVDQKPIVKLNSDKPINANLLGYSLKN